MIIGFIVDSNSTYRILLIESEFTLKNHTLKNLVNNSIIMWNHQHIHFQNFTNIFRLMGVRSRFIHLFCLYRIDIPTSNVSSSHPAILNDRNYCYFCYCEIFFFECINRNIELDTFILPTFWLSFKFSWKCI